MDASLVRDARVRTRAFQVQDLNAVVRVDKESFGKESYSVISLRQAYDLWGGLFRVAETNDGRIVGYGIGATSSRREAASWILALAVSQDARRHGIGTVLAKEVLNLLTELGATTVRLTVEPDNTAARKIFERLGFCVIQFVEDYFGCKQDRLVMEVRHSGPT